MKIPFEWLKEFVNINISANELADRLTLAGLEVSNIEGSGSSVVFDIDILPNRKDCLSVIGVAREVAAITSAKLKVQNLKALHIKKQKNNSLVKVDVNDKKLCTRYIAAVIDNIRIGPSPEWMQKRLLSVGMRPINNIVDITNYLLVETGQPMHAFDLGKISGNKIIIRKAREGEKIKTLDGSDLVLDKNILCVADDEKPVALAGVMGGANSEVDEKTKSIIFESAYFDPENINKTSKKLKLRSESSIRFERGVDWVSVGDTLQRALNLVKQYAGGNVRGVIDLKSREKKPKKISLRLDSVYGLLGITISSSSIIRILSGLGFKMVGKKSGSFVFEIPLYREGDIEREIDIIEEIARIYGYDNIPVTLPKTEVWQKVSRPQDDLIGKIKNIMVGFGFFETKNFSLIDPNSFENINMPVKPLKITNPLTKDNSALATSLIPSLLDVLKYNKNRQINDMAIFEINNVFFPENNNIAEKLCFSGAAAGNVINGTADQTKQFDFYYIKNILESVFMEFPHVFRIIPVKNILLQPGKSAQISVDDIPIGFIGTLHPDVAAKYGFIKDVFIFEIYFDSLLNAVQKHHKFVQIPKYPSVTRDVSLLVPREITNEMIMCKIKSAGKDLVEKILLFDKYKGSQLQEGYDISLAYSVVYRDKARTLTDNEVNDLHGQVLAALTADLGVKLR